MTMNHHSTHSSKHNHTTSAQTPISFNSSTLMSNLATKTTKLFQRNKQQQSAPSQPLQQPMSPDMLVSNISQANMTQQSNQSASNSYLLSTSTNSIESPLNASQRHVGTAAIHIQHPSSYLSSSSGTSPLTFNFDQQQTKTTGQSLRSTKSKNGNENFVNSNDAMLVSSSSNLTNTLTSRRPFKKRSQSNFVDPDAKLWYYNQVSKQQQTCSSSDSDDFIDL